MANLGAKLCKCYICSNSHSASNYSPALDTVITWCFCVFPVTVQSVTFIWLWIACQVCCHVKLTARWTANGCVDTDSKLAKNNPLWRQLSACTYVVLSTSRTQQWRHSLCFLWDDLQRRRTTNNNKATKTATKMADVCVVRWWWQWQAWSKPR